MKLLVFRSTWGLVDDSDGDKAQVILQNSQSKGVFYDHFTVAPQNVGHSFT